MFRCYKGINLGGWLSQCVYEYDHYDSFIGEEDFARIKKMGFDHVRIPIDYPLFETEDGEEIIEGYKYIDNAIRWCQKYDLDMILDLHKTYGYIFDSEETFDFFDDEAKMDRFVRTWDKLAAKYSKYSDFLAFELLNEVVEVRVIDKWNELILRAVETIRKHSEDIYIIFGGVCYNSLTYLNRLPVIKGNIIYTFHCYEPITFTHQGAYWIKGMPSGFRCPYPVSAEKLFEDRKYLPEENGKIYDMYSKEKLEEDFFETIFRDAIDFALKNNLRLYCGEYGVINLVEPKYTIKWYEAINKAFVKYNIGRAAWSYKEMDFGIIDDHYDNYLEDLLKYM